MQQAGRMHTNTNNNKLTIKIERNHSNAICFIVPLLMLIVGFFLCFACVSRARNFSWQDPAAGEAEIKIRFPFELTTAMRCNNNKKTFVKLISYDMCMRLQWVDKHRFDRMLFLSMSTVDIFHVVVVVIHIFRLAPCSCPGRAYWPC